MGPLALFKCQPVSDSAGMAPRATASGASPGVLPPAVAARALAVLFAAGALVALVSVQLPHGHGLDKLGSSIAGAIGLPVSGALWALGRRARSWLLEVALAGGSVTVSAGIYFGHGGLIGVAAALMYMWVALYAGFFLPPRRIVAQVTFAIVCYEGVLWYDGVQGGGAPAVGTLVGGSLVTAAVVTRWLRHQIERVAITDALTGLPNRHAMHAVLQRELRRAERNGSPLAIAMLDLNGLKVVNDTSGHPAGDRLLKEAASCWSTALRSGDLLARIGGDEFALLLPDTDESAAAAVLERLRHSCAVSAAVGLAVLRPGEDADSLIARADAALYEAKASQRAS